MVLKVASGSQIVTQSFKDSISTKITMMYREAKYGQIGVQIRGSITTFVSKVFNSTGKLIKFPILLAFI